MNKYWRFLVESACEYRRSGWCTTYSFSKQYGIDRLIRVINESRRVEPVKNGTRTAIKVFDDFVIKEDIRPIRKRFKTSKIQINQARGLHGLPGEAINTLAASRLKCPSHELLALQYHSLHRSSKLIFSRIHAVPVSEEL